MATHNNKENDTSDPYFQKNAPIAQDLHEDLKKEVNGKDNDSDNTDENSNDANRRTLDESKVVEDDDEEEEEN